MDQLKGEESRECAERFAQWFRFGAGCHAKTDEFCNHYYVTFAMIILGVDCHLRIEVNELLAHYRSLGNLQLRRMIDDKLHEVYFSRDKGAEK